MNTEALRAEFEAWYAQRGLGWCREEDACLAAYQACAAARTEELRVLREALKTYMSAGIGSSTDHEMQRVALKLARAALEAK